MQRTEERLQEERMERVKLEVELGRERDCNRVRNTTKNSFSVSRFRFILRVHISLFAVDKTIFTRTEKRVQQSSIFSFSRKKFLLPL